MTDVNRQWLLRTRPHGMVRDENFELREAPMPARDTETAIRALRALGTWDVCERLGEVSAPTLVICGDSDRSTAPDQSYRLWEGISHSRLCIAPGCAHNVHLERPELFSSVVLDFLTAG